MVSTENAVAQMREVVDTMRGVTEHVAPGSTRPVALLDLVDTQYGFAASRHSGLSLVYADVTDAVPSSWSLQISSAITFDAPVGAELFDWVNNASSQTAVGKFYYRRSRNGGICAVIWETLVPAPLLLGLTAPGKRDNMWFAGELVKIMLDYAAGQAAQTVGQFGGRVMQPTDEDMTTLFVASSGG